MIDMGILDNDIVLIRHQMTAENGDVVVAITEKGATLKVLKRNEKKIFLEPRNKDYPTIEAKRLEIRGVLVGLIRAE
jgi:repressor LexA